MRTWEDFKKNAKELDSSVKEDIEEMETLALIVSAIIEKRNELGYSQRELADISGQIGEQFSNLNLEENVAKKAFARYTDIAQ